MVKNSRIEILLHAVYNLNKVFEILNIDNLLVFDEQCRYNFLVAREPRQNLQIDDQLLVVGDGAQCLENSTGLSFSNVKQFLARRYCPGGRREVQIIREGGVSVGTLELLGEGAVDYCELLGFYKSHLELKVR